MLVSEILDDAAFLPEVASHLVQKEFRALEGPPAHAAFEILDQTEHRTRGGAVERSLVFRRPRVIGPTFLSSYVDFARRFTGVSGTRTDGRENSLGSIQSCRSKVQKSPANCCSTYAYGNQP